MRRVLALLILLLAPARGSAQLIQIAGRTARPSMAVFNARPPAAWTQAALGADLGQIEKLYGQGGAAPVLGALLERYPDPAAFALLSKTERAEKIYAAGLRAVEWTTAEARKAVEEEKAADPASPEYPLLVARLQMLAGPLGRLVEEGPWGEAREAAARSAAKLDEPRRKLLEERMKRVSQALGAETLFEHAAADLPRIPSSVLTPNVARLREARAAEPKWDHRAGIPPVPSPSRSLKLRALVARAQAKHAVVRFAAQNVYVPARDAFRWVMGHAGELYRKYISGQEQDRHNFRFGVVERLFKEGDFRGSFGHPLYDNDLKVMSPLIFRDKETEDIRKQTRSIGRDLVIKGETIPVEKLVVSAMLGVSGMSFPQLSAQSHLSLLYINIMMAKEQGVRMLQNTGEGGPGLMLALLEGDAEKAIKYIVDWNVENGQFERGGAKEAEVIEFVQRLMKSRDELFKDLTPEDLERAQIVAQFGSALNGIRSAEGGYVDFDKLRSITQSPFVKMVQFKLKQAAKRGAKVDPRKVDAIVAALREIPRDKPFKSPEINPDFSSYEDIATLLLATKIVSKKPVSLKFGVGDVEDAGAFLAFLKDAGAMPDHIQIDGAGEGFSPGSGNAPPGADTSLPSTDATIVMDALLRKLGVRDQVYLEATGDVLLPIDGLEKLALGADGISAGRCWMAMGLGCAKVKACANGGCPYGIASRSDSFVGLSLDPVKVAPKGYLAATNWFKAYTQTLSEAGLSDWTAARRDLGLAARSNRLRIKLGRRMWTLDWVYNREYVSNLLRGAMTSREVKKFVFQK